MDETPPRPPADDDSAYRPASELRNSNTPPMTHKQLLAARRNPWIRRRKPSKQRLSIHAGDWSRYVAMLNTAGFAALDLNAATADAFMEGRRGARRKSGNAKSGSRGLTSQLFSGGQRLPLDFPAFSHFLTSLPHTRMGGGLSWAAMIHNGKPTLDPAPGAHRAIRRLLRALDVLLAAAPRPNRPAPPSTERPAARAACGLSAKRRKPMAETAIPIRPAAEAAPPDPAEARAPTPAGRRPRPRPSPRCLSVAGRRRG